MTCTCSCKRVAITFLTDFSAKVLLVIHLTNTVLQVLQEYSKPKKRVVVDSNFKDILESILQTIDNTDYGNHNVRSRNGECCTKD